MPTEETVKPPASPAEGLTLNLAEDPPSAIRLDSRETLVLYSGDTVPITVILLLLGSLFIVLSVYGLMVPDFIGRDQPQWFLWVFGAMGALTDYVALMMYARRQRMAFDFARQTLTWLHAGKGLSRRVDVFSFSDFNQLTPSFQKAVFSDDSDTWALQLRMRNGDTLTVLRTIREETAYRVLRRLVEMAGVDVADAEGLFPLERAREAERQDTPEPTAEATPPTAYIRRVEDSAAPRYEMPSARFSMGILAFALFTAIWLLVVAGGFAAMIREVLHAERPVEPTSVPIFLLFAVVFGGVGLLCLAITLWLLVGRQRITLDPAGIVLEDRLLGATMQTRRLYPSDILRVDAVCDESLHYALKFFLRDKDVVKFGGSLKEAEARWLLAHVQRLAG